MAGYIPIWYPRPKTVTHPSTNRARRALTSFMRQTPLTTPPRRILSPLLVSYLIQVATELVAGGRIAPSPYRITLRISTAGMGMAGWVTAGRVLASSLLYYILPV